jgi:hypothetical protein
MAVFRWGFVATAAAMAACGSFDGGPSPALEVPPAAPTDAGAVEARAPSNALFVNAATGKDDADGRSTDAPLKTIAAAIERVATGIAIVDEIRVCAGRYVETNLQLRVAVSLRGGYSCSTWERVADFGYPAFPSTTETVVVAPPDAKDKENANVTLLVAPPAGHRAFVVDGFTLVSESVDLPSRTLRVDGGDRALVLRDLLVKGAASKLAESDAISVGVRLADSSAEIALVRVTGGAAEHAVSTSKAEVASIGLLLSGGRPLLHDSTIASGGGAAPVGGIALLAVTSELTLHKNRIEAGAATAKGAANGIPSKVLVLSNVNGTIDENQVVLASATCDASVTDSCSATGVEISNAADTKELALRRNTILLGVVSHGPKLVPEVVGVDITAATATPVTFEANVVHVGGFPGVLSRAVRLLGSGPLLFRGNTVFAGAGATQNDGQDHDGLLIGSASGARVTGNLFVGGAPLGTGLRGVGPVARPFTALSDNAFVGFGSEVSLTISNKPGDAPITTFAGLSSAIFATSVSVGSNLVLDGFAVGRLFGSTTQEEIFDAVRGGTLTPRPTMSCRIARSTMAPETTSPADFLGTARTPPASIGAHENDGTCTDP